MRQDGLGPTSSLIGKVEELQDLLIQQRQMADVSKIVEKDAAIRSLNIELGKKSEQINDLTTRLKQLMGAKGGLQPEQRMDSNPEIVEYLSGMLKAREKEMENKNDQINMVLVS